MSPNVLIVEDDEYLARLYTESLRLESIVPVVAQAGRDAIKLLEKSLPQVMILDLGLPDMNGMDILDYVAQRHLSIVMIVVTGSGSVDVAVEAMRRGAFDFLEKPFKPERLMITVRNALERGRLSKLVESYQKDKERSSYHGFIGSSPVMQALYRVIEHAASSRATVFITGESGTGKELCAEAIHLDSERHGKPFVALNCAAIPHELMESEIFGHVKGAFTGAHLTRQGAASRAHTGTLFLDEICELNLDLQSKLLRFVQTGTFQKVGSNLVEQVDIRFVCATNRDPQKEVEEGRFRQDLFYRLHVIPLQLPPLRKRGEDILRIGRHFLHLYSKEENRLFKNFDKATEAILLGYEWPGNIRQLQNVVRNIVVLHNNELVTPEMLPAPLNARAASESAQRGKTSAGIRPLWEVEKETIESAIAHCNGNIYQAAALLQISPSTIYRKRQSWEEQQPPEPRQLAK